MSCYKTGGCGVYEHLSCNECPAGKPSYLEKHLARKTQDRTKNKPRQPINKQVFIANRLCGESGRRHSIVVADTLEDAKTKAKQVWNSTLLSVRAAIL